MNIFYRNIVCFHAIRMRKASISIRYGLVVLLLFAMIFPLSAQGTWQQSGLGGEEIKGIVSGGNALFAGTKKGIYRSMDNGQHWDLMLQTNLLFAAWIITADENGNVYAGSQNDILAYSLDNGTNWQVMSSNNVTQKFGVINSLLVHTNGIVYLSSSDAVYRSRDKGIHWQPMNNGLPDFSDIHTMRQTSSGAVVAGTTGIIGGHVFITRDSGASWTQIYTGILNQDIVSLGTSSSGVLFAGVWEKGAMRSTDEGQHWQPMTFGSTGDVPATAFAFSGNTTYALLTNRMLFRSNDDGLTWTPLENTGLPEDAYYGLAVGSNGEPFLATTHGVYIYTAPSAVSDQPSMTINHCTVAPNPVRKVIHTTFSLAAPSHVRITLFDNLGMQVATLFAGDRGQGEYSVEWTAEQLPPGMYFLHLESGTNSNVQKVLLIP